MRTLPATVFLSFILNLFTSVSFADDIASPLVVQSYYFNSKSQRPSADPVSTISNLGQTEIWQPSVPNKPYHLGVLLPHLNDQYWITASYGLSSYARKLGIELSIYTFDGYIKFGDQRQKLKELSEHVDGIILASIDPVKMDSTIKKIDIPIVGLINDIQSASIKAKAMVSYFDAGFQAGKFVVDDAAGEDISVAIFPGPERSGWAQDMYQGFQHAVSTLKRSGQQIFVHPPIYGDTRPRVQKLRLSAFLKSNNTGSLNYIVGNAVAAHEATQLLKQSETHPKISIVSTYMTRSIFNHIQAGAIKAAPYDQTMALSQLAIDMIVKTLNGDTPGVDFPYHAKPGIQLITDKNIHNYSFIELFGPEGYSVKEAMAAPKP